MFHQFDSAKNAGDILSAGLVLGTLTQILPQVAAVLSITWTVIRIGEWLHSKFKRK
mgnify:CR=1 FL=1